MRVAFRNDCSSLGTNGVLRTLRFLCTGPFNASLFSLLLLSSVIIVCLRAGKAIIISCKRTQEWYTREIRNSRVIRVCFTLSGKRYKGEKRTEKEKKYFSNEY